MDKKLTAIFMLFIVSLFSACSLSVLSEERENAVFAERKAITVGIPLPREFAEANTDFLKGVELAQEEINARGVMGKKLELVIADDRGVFKDAVDVAQNLTNETDVVAVIGHWFSGIAIPVSSIYEKAGVLSIVPTVSNPELTQKGYGFVFQNIPSDKEIAREMCGYALQMGYQKIVIYHEDSSYGENLAEAYENAAKEMGVTIVDRVSGLTNEQALKRARAKWQALDYEAVFLGLNMPEGAEVIKNFRKIDPRTPILAGDGLDVANLLEVLAEDAEGMVIATSYKPTEADPALAEFQKRYRQKYGKEPDVWAIQGYDSLRLVAHVIEQNQSVSPRVLAEKMHQMEPWDSLLGKITFNQSGEVQGRKIYKKQVVQGQFRYIE
ncbi:MAG: ABC transporter substrate-binding protein [Clostridia bacterium]|jgi:branched-chain amino acid transport system substrate-binding protein|nr:ABC transporter substrate-binding protein [Clostridia bacterium]